MLDKKLYIIRKCFEPKDTDTLTRELVYGVFKAENAYPLIIEFFQKYKALVLAGRFFATPMGFSERLLVFSLLERIPEELRTK